MVARHELGAEPGQGALSEADHNINAGNEEWPSGQHRIGRTMHEMGGFEAEMPNWHLKSIPFDHGIE
jgi:hypothetical protein